MSPKKYRWSKVYESAEEELLGFLQYKKINAQRHEMDGYETRKLTPSPDVIQLWGVEGTAKIAVNGSQFSLQPGDTLDIPPNAEATISTAFSNFAWHQSQSPTK